MKKLILLFSVLTLVLSGCNGYETAVNEALGNFENDLEALKQRVERLEKQCTEINNNISALQAIVTALQENDYVTAVTPVTENGKQVGYRISFTKSGDITIYHGKDGKDGANGKDGKDGNSVIQEIEVGDSSVTFTLTDGQVVVIPVAGLLIAAGGAVPAETADNRREVGISNRTVHAR